MFSSWRNLREFYFSRNFNYRPRLYTLTFWHRIIMKSAESATRIICSPGLGKQSGDSTLKPVIGARHPHACHNYRCSYLHISVYAIAVYGFCLYPRDKNTQKKSFIYQFSSSDSSSSCAFFSQFMYSSGKVIAWYDRQSSQFKPITPCLIMIRFAQESINLKIVSCYLKKYEARVKR